MALSYFNLFGDGATTTGLFGGTTTKPMALNLFEVIMIKRPTCEQREVGEKDILILAPVQVMAEGSNTAIAVATQQSADKLKGVDLSNVEIKIRNF